MHVRQIFNTNETRSLSICDENYVFCTVTDLAAPELTGGLRLTWSAQTEPFLPSGVGDIIMQSARLLPICCHKN